ncbi:phage tail tape measure protein [Candidatus Pacearchaeota archaeon]|jgi:TP901 family phage tail tape measure protein|nr:phage tail tape measure protein [Candidatus Pacearchaeota archaeon]
MPGEMVGSAYAKISLDDKELDSGLNSAKGKFSAAVSSMEGKAVSVGKSIGTALAAGTVAAGVAIAGVATVGVKSYMDIESAAADAASKMDLGEIAQKSGKTVGEAFLGIKEHVIAVSRELGQLNTNAFDPTQIATALAGLAAGGFDVASASAANLSPILSLATATSYDLADSAKLAMSTLNQFGMGVDELGRVSDVYTLASGKSAAGMKDFDYAMQQAGPVAKGVGMSFEELTARIAKLADSGYSGEKAGTALRTAFMALTSPTKTQEETLAKLGLTFDDVNPRVHSFSETMDLLLSKGADIYDFGEIYGKEGAAIVYSTAQQNTAVKGLTSELVNSKGAAEQMAKLMLDTLSGSFDAAMGAATDLAIGIGQDLAPTVKGLLDWFSATGAPAIRGLYAAFKEGDWGKIGDTIGLTADRIKAAIAGIGSGLGIAAIGAGFMALVPVVAAMSSGILARWTALKTGTIASTLATKVAVLSNFVAMKASAIANALLTSSSTIVAFVAMKAQAIASTAAMVAGVLAGYASMVVGALSSVATLVAGTVGGIISIGTAIAAPIALIVAGLAGIGLALNPGKFEIFGKIATDTFNGIKDVVKDVWDAIQDGDWDKVVDRLKEAFKDAWDYIKRIDWAGLGSDIVEMVSDGAKAIVNAVFKLGDWIYTNVTKWVDGSGPKKLGQNIVDTIATAIKGWLGSDTSIWGALSKVWGMASDWLSLGWEIIKGIGSGILGKIQIYLAPAKNQFLDFVKSIGDAFFGLAATITSSVGGAINKMGESAAALVTWMGQNIPGVAAMLSSAASSSSGVTSKTSSSWVGTRYVTTDGKVFTDPAAAQAHQTAISTTGDVSVSGISSWGTQKISAYDLYKQKQSSAKISGLMDWYTPMGSEGETYAAPNEPVTSEANKQSGSWSSTQVAEGQTIGESMGEAFSDTVDKNFEVTWTPISKTVADGKTAWDEYIDGLKTHLVSYKTTMGLITNEEIAASKEIGTFTSNTLKDGALFFKDLTISTAKDASTITSHASKAAESILIGGSQTAANAIRLGSEVAANFTTQAGQAVKIGLDASGREIAVIGQVAQQRFTQAGGILYDKVQVAGSDLQTKGLSTGNSLTTGGTNAKSSLETGAMGAKTSLQTGANTIGSALQTGANAIGNAANMVGQAASKLLGFDVASLWKSTMGTLSTSSSSSSGSSSTAHNYGTTSWGTQLHSAEFSSWGKKATGGKTSGPELSLIGEDGSSYPEYVIPTKTKRWDLLLAAMKAYGIPGYAEGTSTGSATEDAVDADKMTAYFGITGLASMSKQVQKIISNLKDFFRISWGIIKAEGSTYWKQINAVLTTEITSIRDTGWQAAIDIRNAWLTTSSEILDDAKAQWASYWPSIEPSITSLQSSIISSFEQAGDGAKYAIDSMVMNSEASLQAFQQDWADIWAQLVTDMEDAQTKISEGVAAIAEALASISVNVNINANISSGGGGGTSYSSSDSSGVVSGNSSGAIQFTDCLFEGFTDSCTGVLVNPLIYTNPQGVTSYINPMTYNSTGGISNYQGAASSGNSSSSYTLPAIFAAHGALLDEGPKKIIAGEAGPEIVLPAKLTRMFTSLADMGFGQAGKANSDRIVIEDHTEHHWYMDGKEVTNTIMDRVMKKMQLRGAVPAR